MDFLWTDGVSPRQGAPLREDVHTDVCVIGGGMAGVLCAARLTAQGIDNVLLEARQTGGGITKGTTAVLTAQHDTLYLDIARMYGTECARQYLRANLDALAQFRVLAQHIDCALETRPSIMYSRTGRDRLREEAAFLRTLGFPAEYTTDPRLPLPVADAVIYPDMAQFHPLRFLNAVAKGLRIYEHTFVTALDGTTAVTAHGRVHAKKVIVATHFPFLNRHGGYFLKLYQKRSYVIVYDHAPQPGCTADDAGSGCYFRSYGDLLLIGGGDHRTGRSGEGYAAVEAFARTWFPGARERYRWSNQDCISLDGIPYIGRYSPALPDVYVATGFNHWGMTTSMAAAAILCDAVAGREHPCAPVFAPGRRMLHPQLFCNLGATLADFVIPTTKRCTHLGCALRWNAAEHSWDCPCHGSRFGSDGALIDNPAMRDAHV